MHVKSLYLNNFRNYNEQSIIFCPYLNIIYGENAQGKTNILEAIYLTSMGRSHRTKKYSEMINWEKEYSRVNIEYFRKTIEGNIDFFMKRNQTKQIKINKVRINKLSEILGNINTVMFSPEHMKIIKDGPSERRRFIDSILSQVKPRYYYNLSQYIKVLNQRNNLLSNVKEKKEIKETLDIWDRQLIEYGSNIIKERNIFIENIKGNVKNINKELSGGIEELSVEYKPSIPLENKKSKEIGNIYKDVLIDSRPVDIRRGFTSYGPHRDEILFSISDKELRNFGSQGQKRSALLSLKLAEMNFIKNETGTRPVLLLDDVFSELDTKRQEYLLLYIKNMQVILSCTDYEGIDFSKINDCSYYKVKAGKILV